MNRDTSSASTVADHKKVRLRMDQGKVRLQHFYGTNRYGGSVAEHHPQRMDPAAGCSVVVSMDAV